MEGVFVVCGPLDLTPYWLIDVPFIFCLRFREWKWKVCFCLRPLWSFTLLVTWRSVYFFEVPRMKMKRVFFVWGPLALTPYWLIDVLFLFWLRFHEWRWKVYFFVWGPLDLTPYWLMDVPFMFCLRFHEWRWKVYFVFEALISYTLLVNWRSVYFSFEVPRMKMKGVFFVWGPLDLTPYWLLDVPFVFCLRFHEWTWKVYC